MPAKLQLDTFIENSQKLIASRPDTVSTHFFK